MYPVLTQEFLIMTIWMFAGATYYSYTVGSMAGIIACLDARQEIISQKLLTAENFASRICLEDATK
jgi:ABC-type methionine transport system permease subunit